MNKSEHVPNAEKTENVRVTDDNSVATDVLVTNNDDDVPTSYHSTPIVQIDRGLGGCTERIHVQQHRVQMIIQSLEKEH